MTTYTATYSPEDNKIRLTASSRLDAETYARVRGAGFIWAPKQDLFVAPMWTPERAALAEGLAGEIGDEDTSLVERAETRAERFEEYSEHRLADYNSAHKAVSEITDGIPLGQPILVGHHSERHARRDAERIENGMRKAVRMWETSAYWTQRAAGALAHAKYKERPDVRARRIKKLEAEERKVLANLKRARGMAKIWADPLAVLKKKDGAPITLREAVIYLANTDGGDFAHEHRRESGYVGPLSLWEAAGGNIDHADPESVAIATPEQVCAKAIANHQDYIAIGSKWEQHYAGRLAYERAMLAESGGTAADRIAPQVGGGCKCWASPRGYLSYIVKVNKVSVTVLDNWGNGGANFTRNIPFDKLRDIISAADVAAARESGRLHDDPTGCGFVLLNDAPAQPKPTAAQERQPAEVEAMRATLEAGITVATVPQLFPTPRELAQRVVDLADVQPGHRVLEPSAGTGALLGALGARMLGHEPERGEVVAVEINGALYGRLRGEFPLTDVRCADFLQCNGDLGKFDRIVMNPPFKDGEDIKHITHAVSFLRPGGRLVALCANGSRQQDKLRTMAEASGGTYEPLPAGSFEAQGTSVNVALVVIES